MPCRTVYIPGAKRFCWGLRRKADTSLRSMENAEKHTWLLADGSIMEANFTHTRKHCIHTDLVVVFVESHLDIKANKFCQVPMCVTVLGTEYY